MVDGEINCSLKDASACENKERRKRFTGPTSVFASKVVLSARNRYEKKKEKKKGGGKEKETLAGNLRDFEKRSLYHGLLGSCVD